jgi:hypothetical protein
LTNVAKRFQFQIKKKINQRRSGGKERGREGERERGREGERERVNNFSKLRCKLEIFEAFFYFFIP